MFHHCATITANPSFAWSLGVRFRARFVFPPSRLTYNLRCQRELRAIGFKALMGGATPNSPMTPEEKARQQIDAMLFASGWRVHYPPVSQRGGLGKAHQLFGDNLNQWLEELNTTLAA
jgi:hypothetical protein